MWRVPCPQHATAQPTHNSAKSTEAQLHQHSPPQTMAAVPPMSSTHYSLWAIANWLNPTHYSRGVLILIAVGSLAVGKLARHAGTGHESVWTDAWLGSAWRAVQALVCLKATGARGSRRRLLRRGRAVAGADSLSLGRFRPVAGGARRR